MNGGAKNMKCESSEIRCEKDITTERAERMWEKVQGDAKFSSIIVLILSFGIFITPSVVDLKIVLSVWIYEFCYYIRIKTYNNVKKTLKYESFITVIILYWLNFFLGAFRTYDVSMFNIGVAATFLLFSILIIICRKNTNEYICLLPCGSTIILLLLNFQGFLTAPIYLVALFFLYGDKFNKKLPNTWEELYKIDVLDEKKLTQVESYKLNKMFFS